MIDLIIYFPSSEGGGITLIIWHFTQSSRMTAMIGSFTVSGSPSLMRASFIQLPQYGLGGQINFADTLHDILSFAYFNYRYDSVEICVKTIRSIACQDCYW